MVPELLDPLAAIFVMSWIVKARDTDAAARARRSEPLSAADPRPRRAETCRHGDHVPGAEPANASPMGVGEFVERGGSAGHAPSGRRGRRRRQRVWGAASCCGRRRSVARHRSSPSQTGSHGPSARRRRDSSGRPRVRPTRPRRVSGRKRGRSRRCCHPKYSARVGRLETRRRKCCARWPSVRSTRVSRSSDPADATIRVLEGPVRSQSSARATNDSTEAGRKYSPSLKRTIGSKRRNSSRSASSEPCWSTTAMLRTVAA